MNGIIINGKTYVAVEYVNCDNCDLYDICYTMYRSNICSIVNITNRNNIMFKELKTEENTKNIDNIK